MFQPGLTDELLSALSTMGQVGVREGTRPPPPSRVVAPEKTPLLRNTLTAAAHRLLRQAVPLHLSAIQDRLINELSLVLQGRPYEQVAPAVLLAHCCSHAAARTLTQHTDTVLLAR
jgi:hypothetical protein